MKRFYIFAFALMGALMSDTQVAAQDLCERDVIVIAHRGASGERPEHTLASYDLAIDLGADKLVSYVAEGDMPRNEDGEKMKARSPYTGPHTTALAW